MYIHDLRNLSEHKCAHDYIYRYVDMYNDKDKSRDPLSVVSFLRFPRDKSKYLYILCP